MALEIRDARAEDLPAIVAIYNATVPGRQVTADLEPVTVASRRPWFERHSPGHRPLWVVPAGEAIAAWLSFEPFYGRPAYQATVEISLYVSPDHRGRGVGGWLLDQAIVRAPKLGITTLLGFIFSHNQPSLALFRSRDFQTWGQLPQVAVLDGVARSLSILGRKV